MNVYDIAMFVALVIFLYATYIYFFECRRI
jgi:hypothetical protein